jgi:DNA helicase II / ATP-dependent DNA helicase PcrA
VTRAQKYLMLSYSPGDSQMYAARSSFFDFAARNTYVLTAEVPPRAPRAEPKARHEIPEVSSASAT